MQMKILPALVLVLCASSAFASSKWVCDAEGHDMYGNPVGPVPGFAYENRQEAELSAIGQCQIYGGIACNVTFCSQSERP